MTPQVIAGIIIVTWVFPMLSFMHSLFNADGYIKVAQYGTCILGSAFIKVMLTYLLPIFSAAFLSLLLLSVKAYHVQKKIKSETSLRGVINDIEALKTKQCKIPSKSIWAVLQANP